MSKRVGVVALECLFDLGITIVYAVIVGVFIVGIVASDNGPISILHAGLYAMLLPLAAVGLIGTEIGLRIFKDWRASRRPVAWFGSSRPNSGWTEKPLPFVWQSSE